MKSSIGLSGSVAHTIVKGPEKLPEHKISWKEVLYWSLPRRGLTPEVWLWRQKNYWRMCHELWRFYLMVGAARISGYPFMHGKLFVAKMDGVTNEIIPFGLASLRVVASAGRDEVVDEFDAATAAGFDLTTFNYHGIGTGTTAAVAGDTDVETELTTEYNPNSTRATGTQSQPTSDVYQSLGTNTLDSGTPAITEHGLLSNASVGSGTLLDRHVFAAINLDGTAGDGLQSTYQLTIASGG